MSISLRPDLAVLSAEDLAAMANRGLVKRAQKEVEAGELKVTWQETPDGTVVANWSDSVTCTIPGGKILADSKCTCGALEMCRHILRSVLAWQIWKKSTPELVAVKDATSEPAEEAGAGVRRSGLARGRPGGIASVRQALGPFSPAGTHRPLSGAERSPLCPLQLPRSGALRSLRFGGQGFPSHSR
jgi:hypothetical protein